MGQEVNLYKLHSRPETLDHHDVAFEKVPELVWNKYRGQPAELKKREKALAKNAETAYSYALLVLHKRFPAGEAAIAEDAHYAYYYAVGVLKKSFLAGEAAIAKDAWYAGLYAYDVLKLPGAEATKWGKEHRND